MFLLGGEEGGSFFSSVVSEEVYDPVFDTEMDSKFLWNLLPSFYRDLMDDKEVFEVLWSGLMQQLSGVLLNLWTTDYAKSLRDIPVISQRKWFQLDLVRELEFEAASDLETYGLGAEIFLVDVDSNLLSGTWSNRARNDKVFISLRGEVNEKASLSLSVHLNVASAEKRAMAFFGYLSSRLHVIDALTTDRLADAFGVIVFGTVGGDTVAGILHVDPQGTPSVSLSSYVLTLGTDYRFDFSYAARTGVAVLEVVELKALKFSGTSGATLGEASNIYTSEFSDANVNFDTEQIAPGDLLVLFGVEYEILSVDGSLLTTKQANLPVDLEGLTYQVYGPVTVTSLSFDLPGDAALPTFVCDQFGTSILDMRSVTSAFYASPGLGTRRSLSGTTWSWSFLDPTLEERVISLPRLQDKVTDPTLLLQEHFDYSVSDRTLYFQEPPAEGLWAEYVGFDEHLIEDNFGLTVGLSGESSDQYKARVRGLYYAYFRGPTPEAIRTGVHILVGLPIAEKSGTVEAINPSFSGTMGVITVGGSDYLYPLMVGTDLQVGDNVATFQPLSRGVEVSDYLNDPEWYVNFASFNELLKFHTFLVRLNIDIFSLDTLALVSDFLVKIKPTWKDFLISGFKNMEEDVDIEDELRWKVTLQLFDQTSDVPWASLDSYDYSMEPGYTSPSDPAEVTDWLAAQATGATNVASGIQRATATLLTGMAFAPIAPIGPHVPVLLGLGTSFVSDIGGPGAVTDKRVALQSRTSGTGTGRTTKGSNVFRDPTPDIFSRTTVGDHVAITGETADFEVIRVVNSNRVVLDHPAAHTSTSATWISVGAIAYWYLVDSVTSDTVLVLADDVQTESGNYNIYLLDNAYFEVLTADQFSELSPEEELTFVAHLSASYVGALPLNVDLPDSQTTTQTLQFTDYTGAGPGDTVSSTVAEP